MNQELTEPQYLLQTSVHIMACVTQVFEVVEGTGVEAEEAMAGELLSSLLTR